MTKRPMVRSSAEAERRCGCGVPLEDGRLTCCECMEADIREVEAQDDWPDCSCIFCMCMNSTEFGEVCGDCLHGAHQG